MGKYKTIEVFFRDAKQLRGLGRAQVRQPQAVLTHIVLVCLAYVGLQLLKPLSPQAAPEREPGQESSAPPASAGQPRRCSALGAANGGRAVGAGGGGRTLQAT